MAERKVINKYIPNDFDPELLPRVRRKPLKQMKITFMLPFSVRCTVCGEYMYRGKKFNARKETVEGEDYLGLKVFRFYLKCTKCSSEYTLKTDPKASDYSTEWNCKRLMDPWKKKLEEGGNDDEEELDDEEKAEVDKMKLLEERKLRSKQEIENMDQLNEIKQTNAQLEKLKWESLMQDLERKKVEEQLAAQQEDLTQEENEQVNEFLQKMKQTHFARKIIESDEDSNNEDEFHENTEDQKRDMKRIKKEEEEQKSIVSVTNNPLSLLQSLSVKKRGPSSNIKKEELDEVVKPKLNTAASSTLSLLGNYDSSDAEEETSDDESANE